MCDSHIALVVGEFFKFVIQCRTKVIEKQYFISGWPERQELDTLTWRKCKFTGKYPLKHPQLSRVLKDSIASYNPALPNIAVASTVKA